MKILFLGEIFGLAGRKVVKKLLPEVKEKYSPSIIIANAENLTHGNGFSPEHIKEMQSLGITYFTSGDHAWGMSGGAMKLSDGKFPVLRPYNYPSSDTPGKGYTILEDSNLNKILLINLIGQVFMKKNFDCPFKAMDKLLRETSYEKFSAIFVDFHAEATSEKYAMSFYLDGRVSGVVGTHTHVATRDARILKGGTAALSDVGMIGALDSVIGLKKEVMINSFLTQMPVKHETEEDGRMIFNAVLIEVDEKNGKALNIEHIQQILDNI